jgi:hypothetical protein
MTEINKDYILRLFTTHDLVMRTTFELQAALRQGADSQTITSILDELDFMTGEMERIFSEVLTDEERSEIRNESIGKNGLGT